jgi:hypothetical protein
MRQEIYCFFAKYFATKQDLYGAEKEDALNVTGQKLGRLPHVAERVAPPN